MTLPDRNVPTPYGPMPGCPDCGVIVLQGPHICEHGVTTTPTVEASFTITLNRDEYERFTRGIDDEF
jgi:hypothetical protein